MKRPLFEPLKRQVECKFKDACNLYTGASYTCTHFGGSYCGKYRKLNREKNSDNLIALSH
jgi:hypothetical protein